jgi:hypothetical protein
MPPQGLGTDRGMTDLNPQVQQQAQGTIQEIVERLSAGHAGDDVEHVQAELTRELSAAGLPEQPEKWVRDTAAEIAAGRTIVVDRAVREEDDPRREQ